MTSEAASLLAPSTVARPGVVPVRVLTETSVATYFFFSLLYYINALPAGHIMNVAFLLVFSGLAVLQSGRLMLSVRNARTALLLLLLPVISLSSWILRDDWDGAGLLRSVTWLTPIALLVLLANSPPLRHSLICLATATISLIVNLLVTAAFTAFNPSIVKFEATVSWTWISSNELSFHLIAFCFLFFVLAGVTWGKLVAVAVGLGSIVHLSKAHLASAIAAPVIGFCRRRLWLIVILSLALVGLLRWMVINDAAPRFEIPPGVERVFGPLQEMIGIAATLAFSEGLPALAAVADSVGLFRFEVYAGAVDLIPRAPFGASQSVVDQALGGLDPHSNVIYLATREGWATLATYLLVTVALVGRIPTRSARERVVIAALIYLFIRTLFLTFDPIKLICVTLYAGFVLQPDLRATTTRPHAPVTPLSAGR